MQVVMKFLNHSPLEGKKFQLVCWVVEFSLAQASTGIGYYCFSAIISGLIEDSSSTSATSISVELDWLGEICICKNRCHGTESLQVIKGLFTLAVHLNGSLFFTVFSLEVNSCRGYATCMNLGINQW